MASSWTDRRRWPVWPIGPALAIGCLVLTFSLLPGRLDERLMTFLSGICPQRPSHSVFLGGLALPLETRMAGIFAGFLLVQIIQWATGHGRAAHWGRPWVPALGVGLILLMGLDGLNAFAWDLNLPTPYAPEMSLRLVTGLLAGFGLSILTTPILATIVWPAPVERSVLGHWWHLLPSTAGLTAIGLAVRAGWGIWYYPLSLLTVGGVLAVMAAMNAIVLLLLSGRDGRLDWSGTAVGWLGLATTLGVIELLGLGLLRAWTTQALGLHWETH